MNQEHFSTSAQKGKHLCLWEREEIEKALRCGAGIRSIAKVLGRSASTISREIKRGTVKQRIRKEYVSSKRNDLGYIEKEIYFADTGQTAARNNTGRRGGKYKLFEDMKLVRYIEEKILKDKWSPAMVIGWLKEQGHDFKIMVCFKTVYNYIDRGQLTVKNIDLLLKPRLKVKKRRIRQQKRILGKSIELRPLEVETREEFGHWEGDTIIGKGRNSAVLTLVGRKTNKGFMLYLKDRRACSVMKAFSYLSDELKGTRLFKTVTFDNGSEFADCSKLESDGIGVYFARPYSAYERGINENYNGIIRRYIPKGKDLNALTQSDLIRINNQIDTLPRKRHNFKTAQMMFDRELENIFGYTAV